MFKAVIFDLDGTLADTLPLCIEAFRRAIDPLSGTPVTDDEIIGTFGPSEEATILRLVPDRFDEGIRAYWRWYAELHGNCPEPFPGMRGILERLRAGGVRLGLVTGKSRTSAMMSLERFGLTEVFDALEFGSPEGSRKDEAMLAIVREFGLSPGEAVYVGDAPSDIEYSRRAGVPVASAAWAPGVDADRLARLEPDWLFPTLGEFEAFVAKDVLGGLA